MLEMLDDGERMGYCKDNMRTQKRTKLAGSERQK